MIRPDKHYSACDSKMARSKKNVPLLYRDPAATTGSLLALACCFVVTVVLLLFVLKRCFVF